MTRRPRTVVLAVIGLMAAALAIGVVHTGRTRTGDRDRLAAQSAEPVPVVIAASPSAVVTVRVKSGHTFVELDRTSTGWHPRPGTATASAALLGERQGDLLPLRAYRVLGTSEPRPDFGLADPELVLEIDEGAGRSATVEVGAPTFNGEGFYARRRGDSRIYLLTRRAVDGLRSALRGEPVSTARSDPERERLATAEQLSDSELISNPWLDQILAEEGP